VPQTQAWHHHEPSFPCFRPGLDSWPWVSVLEPEAKSHRARVDLYADRSIPLFSFTHVGSRERVWFLTHILLILHRRTHARARSHLHCQCDGDCSYIHYKLEAARFKLPPRVSISQNAIPTDCSGGRNGENLFVWVRQMFRCGSTCQLGRCLSVTIKDTRLECLPTQKRSSSLLKLYFVDSDTSTHSTFDQVLHSSLADNTGSSQVIDLVHAATTPQTAQSPIFLSHLHLQQPPPPFLR